MKLVLSDSSYLKESISIISELVNEGCFKVRKEGIELSAMDPANVAMVIFKLLPSCFIEYTVKEDVDLGINLAGFKQILRRSNATDSVTLLLDDPKKLTIIFSSNTIRTFTLPVIEMESREQKIPNLSFQLEVSTHSSLLSSAVDDVSIIAESVQFLASPESFILQGDGDLSHAKIEMKNCDETRITVETPAKSKYAVEYLKKMVQGSKISDTVSIRFDNNYPLKLEYKAIDKCLLSFILAPRVDND